MNRNYTQRALPSPDKPVSQATDVNDLSVEDVATMMLCEHAVKSGLAASDPEAGALVDGLIAKLVARHPQLATSRHLWVVKTDRPEKADHAS